MNDEKKRKVEWSFSFEDLGEELNRFFSSLAGEAEVQTTELDLPLEGTTSADMRLHFSLGRTSLSALPSGSASLLQADITHVGELVFRTEGGEHKTVTLKQKSPASVVKPMRDAFRALASRDDLKWDLRLSPDVPLDLKLDGGVGPASVDLSGLNVTALDIDAGVGEMQITLPVSQRHYRAALDGGVGAVRVIIPAGTSLELDVDGGVGQVDIVVDEDAAVRVKVSGGLGGHTLPDHFEPVEERDEFLSRSGIWQTPGFDLAQKRITIKHDGGVGALRVRTAERV